MSKVVDFDQLYPNRFLKAGEFNRKDVTLKITDVDLEVLEGEGGKKSKGILTFEKTKKQLVLNKTNGECIKAMFGRNVPGWIGKRITLFPADVVDSFTGEMILAIRVRGSPDIEADKVFTAKIGRKQVSLKVTKTRVAGEAKIVKQAPTSGSVEPSMPPKNEPLPPPVDESAEGLDSEPTPDEQAEIAAQEAAAGGEVFP